MKLTKKQITEIKNHYRLSPRDVDILKIIFEGIHSNQEIADRLQTSILTAKNMLHHLYCKLGYNNKLTIVVKLLEKFPK